MNGPFLTYGNLQLLNVPHGKPIYDEVLVQDCYRRESIPVGSIVIDVGGFYGEFGIWCAVNRGCHVWMYEPSQAWQIARLNAELNNAQVNIINAAIGREVTSRAFHYRPDHPAGSRLGSIGQTFPCVQSQQRTESDVQCLTLATQIRMATARVAKEAPVCVKIDCEGGEQEIFEDESWIPMVDRVMLEFHYKDGPKYREILDRHGFALDTTDANPEAWMALIYAQRK